eukprot:1256515-Rhodomonas_salina.1
MNSLFTRTFVYTVYRVPGSVNLPPVQAAERPAGVRALNGRKFTTVDRYNGLYWVGHKLGAWGL